MNNVEKEMHIRQAKPHKIKNKGDQLTKHTNHIFGAIYAIIDVS
jgi:hypothetical protein